MHHADFLDDEKERKSPLSPERKLSRDEILLILSEQILSLRKRSMALLFKPSQHGSPRLGYSRLCLAASKTYSEILKDNEIETLKREMEAYGRVKDIEIATLKRENEALKRSKGDAKT
jgi:hypothetical protein